MLSLSRDLEGRCRLAFTDSWARAFCKLLSSLSVSGIASLKSKTSSASPGFFLDMMQLGLRKIHGMLITASPHNSTQLVRMIPLQQDNVHPRVAGMFTIHSGRSTSASLIKTGMGASMHSEWDGSRVQMGGGR